MISPTRKLRRIRRQNGFTLVEIMIVMSIMGIVVAIAIPGFFRQRHLSQQRSCQENLQKIGQAKEQYALENNIASGATVVETDLYYQNQSGYLKTLPKCPASGDYDYKTIGEDPSCTITDPFDHNEIPNFIPTGGQAGN
jgi:prepilin-type N-terminal cleavage/methylation domain-containing protein